MKAKIPLAQRLPIIVFVSSWYQALTGDSLLKLTMRSSGQTRCGVDSKKGGNVAGSMSSLVSKNDLVKNALSQHVLSQGIPKGLRNEW